MSWLTPWRRNRKRCVPRAGRAHRVHDGECLRGQIGGALRVEGHHQLRRVHELHQVLANRRVVFKACGRQGPPWCLVSSMEQLPQSEAATPRGAESRTASCQLTVIPKYLL